MSIFLGTLIVALIPVVVVTLGFYISDWLAHVTMVKNTSKKYGKAKYADFVREFNKIEIVLRKHNKSDNYFKIEGNTFSASVIEFDGIGMIMRTPWDWFRVKRYVKRRCKEIGLIHDWSKIENDF